VRPNKSAALAILLFASMAVANEQPLIFRASVPFDFVIGRKTLPAGTYFVQSLGGDATKDGTGVIVVKSTDGRLFQSIITRLSAGSTKKRSKSSRLLFIQYQGKRYLNRMLVAGERATQEVVSARKQSLSQGASFLEVRLVQLH